tara:strand:- start:100 stop:576 length:477 start_codon:yes stop_codon:yes gene_type:complete
MAGFVGGSAANPVEVYQAVIAASNQPFDGGSFEDVIFDSLPLNSVGGTPLNVATGVFTVPAGMAGYWKLESQLYMYTMQANNQYQMRIDVDSGAGGVTVSRTIVQADTVSHFFSCSYLGSLAVGDAIGVRVKCAGSYDLTEIDGNSIYSWITFTYYPR